MFESNQSTTHKRLDSWKEIAAYFGRDERTINRWEKKLGLPIHRLPGTKGRVYAFSDELSQWLESANSSHLGLQDEAARGDPETATIRDLIPLKASSTRKVLRFGVAAAVAVVLVVGATRFVRLAHLSASRTASAKYAPNPEALDLYLKGRYEWSKRTPGSLNKAVDYFTQAIVRDPGYAQAYAGLSDTFNLLREYTVMPSTEAYPRAIAAARKAVELDDSLSEAHRALAFASFYWTWDFPGAERQFKRAIELNPKDPTAHHWYATSLLNLGRFSDALSQIEEARQLDPSSISVQADRALVLFYSQREEEFVSIIRQIETTDPTFLSPHRYRADIALAEGNFQSYLLESKTFAELAHDASGLEISKDAEKGYARGGAKGLLKNVLQAQRKYYRQGLVPGFVVAKTCALLRKNDEGIQYLEDDFKKHEPGIVTIRAERALVGLHNDPRFRNLLSRIGLPPL